MKVVVVSHTYISPINRDKWTTLADRHPDAQVTVITPRYWPTHLFKHEAKQEVHHSPTCSFIPIETFKEGNELLYGYTPQKLYTVIKKINPDIIHVEQGAGAFSYFQINCYVKMLKLKAKSIFFTWLNWQQKNSFKHTLLLSPLEKINLRCAHGAIAGNHDAKKILQQKGFQKPIVVLPQLGINPHIFKPAHIIKNSSERKKYIAYIGRITEEKGVFYLAQAFIQLSEDFPEWNLLFIGDGPAYERLRSFITNKRMQKRINFCAPAPHHIIAQLLQNIDIMVLPSYDTPTWREQFGHVLIEAMACNVPIIGSSAGEIPHVIKDAGLVFEQRNERALLAQLKTLMQDDELRKKFGTLGYQRAMNNYTHDIIADKTYEFWQQLKEM
jgi:glycosyltransferase involved in cell wall biosynthesis